MNIVIGGAPIEVVTGAPAFRDILQAQYANFVEAGLIRGMPDAIRIEVDLIPETADIPPDVEAELEVSRCDGVWHLTRGDFHAVWNPERRSAVVRQSANRHSIDSVIRIIHSLTLVAEGGFLLHSASAIRNGRAWLFAGRSGAGKTTLSRLAPADACLLSDEVSFVRNSPEGYLAWGTPFTGELGEPGANRCAPIEALCFLEQANTNRLTHLGRAEALHLLMTNILFFAEDADLVTRLFAVAGDFIDSVKIYRLSFLPEAGVWDLIQ